MLEIFKILGTVALNGVDETNKDLDSVTKQGEKSESKLTSAFKKIGTVVITAFATDKIIGFGKTCVETAASIKASNSQFEQTFGDMQGAANKAMLAVADDSGILKTRLQDVGTSIYAFAKTTGADSATSMDIMSRALQVTADSAAYYDRSLEDTAESLKSFLKGNYENDAALGLSATETTRNTAANKLYGKSFKDLSESQKQLVLLQMVEDANKLSGALGQAARESDGYENIMGNLNESWRQFLGIIGGPILSSVIPIIQKITDEIDYFGEILLNSENVFEAFAYYFNETIANVQKKIPQFAQIASSMLTKFGENIAANLPTVISKGLDMVEGFVDIVASNLPTVITAGMNMLHGIVKGIVDALPVLIEKIPTIVSKVASLVNDNLPLILQKGFDIIVTLVTGIINAIPTLVSNIPKIIKAIINVWMAYDWLKLGKTVISGIGNGIGGMASSVTSKIGSIFGKIKDAILSPVETAKNLIKAAIDKIKGFFSFKIEWPKIKLPHFSIKGSFNPIDWLTEGIPKIGVDWYAKGGIMTQPTAFGINPQGNVMVGGEAGNEAIAPLSKLEEYYKKWSMQGNTEMLEVLAEIRNYLADDERWYKVMLRALADGSFAIVLDGREVGRIVRKYA